MRRKSDRNKGKSPEKVEKPKRGRPPRRRKKSSSSSPDRVSVTEEVVPDIQDVEMSQVQMTSTSEMPNPIIAPSDNENTEQVWHVKASESSGDAGEKIQKLKICLSRPSSTPERPDRSPRGRKKLNRTSQLEFSSESSSEDKRKSRHRSRRGSTRDSNTEENIYSDNAECDVPSKEIAAEKPESSGSPPKEEFLATPLDDKVFHNKETDKLKTPKPMDCDSKVLVEEVKIPKNDNSQSTLLLLSNSETVSSSQEDNTSSEKNKIQVKREIPSSELLTNIESNPKVVKKEFSHDKPTINKVSNEEASKTTALETVSMNTSTKLEVLSIEKPSNDSSDAVFSNKESSNVTNTNENTLIISTPLITEFSDNLSCEPASKKETSITEKAVSETAEVENAGRKPSKINSPPGENIEMTCKSPKVDEVMESSKQCTVSNDKVKTSPVKSEESPIPVERSPIHVVLSPIHVEKSPIHIEKSPIQVEKSSNQKEKSPEQVQKSPVHVEDISVESSNKSNGDVPLVKAVNDEISHKNTNQHEGKVENITVSNIPVEVVSTGSIRKRKWGSRTSKITKASIVSISTDSLKNLISHVEPVSEEDVLMDIKLKESHEIKSDKVRSVDDQGKSNGKYGVHEKKKDILGNLSHRKISIVNEEIPKEQRPPSPPRYKSSPILYITNLVRPFTLPQLKNLLQRTGKLAENGFWIDKIKSRCFVQYQTEDEAIETRHALHGVTWPVSNPKTLNVDFGLASDMREALASGEDEKPVSHETWPKEQYVRDSKTSGKENDEKMFEKRTVVREWDVGKGEGLEQRVERQQRGVAMGGHHSLDPLERGRKRRSKSPSPARKFKKKEEEAPSKLLDDLFKKTKATPCIYWLPLNAETILVKEEQRRKHMAEHERRMEELRRAAEQDQRGPRNPPHHSSTHRHR